MKKVILMTLLLAACNPISVFTGDSLEEKYDRCSDKLRADFDNVRIGEAQMTAELVLDKLPPRIKDLNYWPHKQYTIEYNALGGKQEEYRYRCSMHVLANYTKEVDLIVSYYEGILTSKKIITY